MSVVSVLEIRSIVESIRFRTYIQIDLNELNSFLDSTPLTSNYLFENNFGLLGFNSTFLQFTAGFKRSSSNIRQHISVQNLNPLCEVELTSQQLETLNRFKNLLRSPNARY